MKTKTLFYMALTAVMTTLAACSQDDELMDAAPKPAAIEFEITDGGYGGDEATRAVEDGFRTKFEAGDKCGLYIIEDGEFKASNVTLTAEAGDNGEITWKAADGAISDVTENSKYFLYYPYDADAYNRVSSSASGDKDTDFFAELISNWSVYTDQSTYEKYTQSDLMTATGTPSIGADGKLKVSFSMTHRMALAVIEVPRTVYKFTDKSIPDYVPTLVDFTVGDHFLQPYRMADGTYRRIVNPIEEKYFDRCITGTITGNKKFTIPSEKLKGINKEKYTRFVVGGGAVTEINHNLQVGDCLLKDGNLIKVDQKDALTAEQKANVAALVFVVGHNQYDNSDYSKTGIGSEKCHGYAVALQEAAADRKWGLNTTLGCYPEWVNSAESRVNDWNGYGWTQKIRTAAGNKLMTSYPAAYYAVYYGGMDAPSNSSGWFLPSIGQLNEVWQAQVTANLFGDVGDHLAEDGYWSSSEDYGYTECVLFVNSKDNKVSSDSKEASKAVRAVLAF